MTETMLPLWEVAAREIGERAGQACAAKAEAAGFDADAARSEIMSALELSGRPMSGEELVDVCLAAGIVPHDCRAFGPVFGTLSRRGLIEAVGFATRRKGHGTAGARLWKVSQSQK